MRRRLALTLTFGILALALPPAAGAATFVVDDLTDTTDGSCAAPDCTLREAIDLANANGSAVTDDITFGGVAGGTIPVGALPLSALTTPTNVDGTTATGYNTLDPKPVIEIDGGGAGADYGVQMQGGSTVTALSVNGFDVNQILLAVSSNNTVSANWVGIGLDGSTPGLGQSSAWGIYANSGSNFIGTATAGGGNVVSGNDAGIVLQSANNTIYNNFVGTDRDGQASVPNGDGIRLAGANLNTIGGSAFNQGNLMSGNTDAGVEIDGGSSGNQFFANNIGLTAGLGAALPNGRGVVIPFGDQNDIGGPGAGNVIAASNSTNGVQITGLSNENRVQGNFIGTSGTGTAFGNLGSGVFVGLGASDNLIGGTTAAEGNVIANSGDNGVGILRGGSDTRGNRVLLNRIFASGDLGIDLGGTGGADGVTPNDANDADTEATLANRGQNFPVITSAVKTGATTLATGTLDAATAGVPHRIEIFRSATCNAFGFGEGANFAASVTPTTNGSGDATFSVPVPGAELGDVLTATATDFPVDPSTSSGTSEFSACRTVTAPPAGGGGGPTPPPAASSALPPPVTGKTFNSSVKRGTVSVKCPADRRFRGIRGDNDLRIGCQIDTRTGRIAITTTAGGGKTQTAQFYDGIFRVGQTRGARPITEVRLTGKLENCAKKSKRASAAARKRKGRRLWGKGKGRFRTRGKRSSALVRGTTWLVEDRCDGSTLTRVAEGTVTVRDFARRRNVTVKKGRRYVAKAPKKGKG